MIKVTMCPQVSYREISETRSLADQTVNLELS